LAGNNNIKTGIKLGEGSKWESFGVAERYLKRDVKRDVERYVERYVERDVFE
jgi:hypothetical protein